MIEKSVKYSVQKIWLYILISLGVTNLILGLTAIIVKGLEFVYISPVIIGIVFIYQFRSLSQFGYVAIKDEEILINNGLTKTKFVITDINGIIRRQNSLRLITKSGKTNSIGLNLIEPKLRLDFVDKIIEIENKINMTNRIK